VNEIRAVAIYTIRDGIRRKAWFPFAFGLLLGALLIFIQYGVKVQVSAATPYAENIISSFFFFWVWGALFTTAGLGASAIPIERRSQALLTLPIARWKLIAGKLIGTQVISAVILISGYLFSFWIAHRQHLEITWNSVYGLAAALTASFVVLCLSVPLGVRLPAMVTGTLTIAVLLFNSLNEELIRRTGLEWPRTVHHYFPWMIPTVAMNNAFFKSNSNIDYLTLTGSALIAVLFLSVVTLWTRNSELSRD